MPTLSSNIVKREVASVQDVEEALARQAMYGGDLATNLLELSSVSEARLSEVLAESLGLEPAPAGELPAAPDRIRRLVSGDVAQRYGLCPLAEADGRLIVAVSDPLPPEVLSDLEFSLGLPILQRSTTLVRIQQAIARDYGVALDQRMERVLARLAGRPDPHPSVPAAAPDPLPEAELAAPLLPAHPEQDASVSDPAPQAASAAVSMAPPLADVDPGPSTAPAPPEPALPPTKAARRVNLPNVDLFAMARAGRKGQPKLRRRGPYTLAMAEEDLLDAETRDEVVAAFFDFCAQYFEYAALFAVHGDLAEGRNAHGAGAARAKVQAIGVPLDLPSTLAAVVASDPYRLVRLSASGLDGALAKDLERRPGPAVLVLPIRVRERAVLVFYGDHGGNDVALDAIGDVLSFAPLAANALERMILRRKERARTGDKAPTGLPSPASRKPRRADLPSRGERASALASVLESSTLRRAPEAEASPLRSVPPLARPMISIGPSRTATSQPAQAELPSAAQLPSLPATASLRPYPSARPTPIPSSFAPGAPPHQIVPQERRPILAPSQPTPDEGWDDPDPPFDAKEPPTKPGVGSVPPVSLSPRARQATPLHMPAPPASGAALPPEEPHELERTQRYRMPVEQIERALAPDHFPEQAPAAPRDELRTDPPPRPFEPEAPLAEIEIREQQDDSPELSLGAEESPEVSLGANAPGNIFSTDDTDEDSAPIAPRSRSLAHSARPLPAPQNSKELRLPAVIVDLAQDTEELVARAAASDPAATERLVQIGAAAVPALVGAFPGPITAELRRAAGEGPPRASDCGPLLKVLARIGPKAAGVLAVRSNDKEPTTRAWATRLLGEMPCLDAARAVSRRFVDDDAEVRRAALAAGRMLQVHPNAGAVLASTLSEMLLDATRQDRLQHMVVEAIADLREARSVPALATLLATGSPEIQRSAHWALVVLARTDYADNAAAWDEWWRVNSSRHRIEWLIDALMHESQEVRRAAGDELKSLTKEYFGYYDDLPARERERAQKRYRDWWDSKGKARFMSAP